VWVGQKLYTRYEKANKHKRNAFIAGGVTASVSLLNISYNYRNMCQIFNVINKCCIEILYAINEYRVLFHDKTSVKMLIIYYAYSICR